MGQGGGLGPKRLCTKSGPTRFYKLYISFFPTMVTWVWGGRGGGGGIAKKYSAAMKKY